MAHSSKQLCPAPLPAPQTTVVLCGAGNAVHVLAASLGSRPADFRVLLFAPFSDEAARLKDACTAKEAGVDTRIEMEFRGKSTTGVVEKVSKSAVDVIPQADVVLIALPSFTHEDFLKHLKPHLRTGTLIGVVPGQGNFPMLARRILGDDIIKDKKITLAGVNQLPYQCRIKEFGKSVQLLGHKAMVSVATEPMDAAPSVAKTFDAVFDFVKFRPLGHFMNVTLQPANQCIHPGVCYGLFARDFPPGKEYDEAPLFYANVDADIAAVLEGLCDDVQKITNALQKQTGIDLSGVPTMKDMMLEFYEDDCDDTSTLHSIFSTNKGYENLYAPMKKLANGKLVPDFGYRYFTEDIPRGLAVLKGYAQLAGAATPTIDKVLLWAQQMMDREYLVGDRLDGKHVCETTAPQALGILDIAQLRFSE